MALSDMTRTPRPSAPITRLVAGRIHAYDVADDSIGVLSPAASFEVAPGDTAVDHTAWPDLRHAVYTTLDAAVCFAAGGTEVWRSAFEPPSTELYGHRPGCAVSLDGSVVWIYRPDAMAGRAAHDQWVVLDSRSGAVVARTDLVTVGHGGEHFRHPDGTLLLDVGEGQDGSVIFRGTLGGDGRLDLDRYPWNDRCLVALAPDGSRFMTVDHEQGDVAIHDYPDGQVTLRLSVEDFGHDPDEVALAWTGGYLTEQAVIVALGGETEPGDQHEDEEEVGNEEEDGQEWFRHYLVDLGSGRIEEFEARTREAYDLDLFGDGSWLTTDSSGHPARWRAP